MQGLLVSLEGISFSFLTKNELWLDLQLKVLELNGGKYQFYSKENNQMCAPFSAPEEQISLLCTKVVTNKDFKQKLTILGEQKETKTFLNLELIAGKEMYIQRQRFTFDKHFLLKLHTQTKMRP